MANLTVNSILESALNFLESFANLTGSDIRLQEIFGAEVTPEPLLKAWRNREFTTLPKLTVVDSATINGALGAYGRETDTIYLSQQLLATGDLAAITAVFLEEYGHYLDAQLNSSDTLGDEGQLFSAIVRGIELSPDALASIQAEDDTAQVVINGQSVTIEQAITESNEVFVRGFYVYSVGVDGAGNDALTVFDVQGPDNPNPDGSEYNFTFDPNVPAPGFPAKGPALNNPTSVQVVRDYAYIGDANGIRIISISDPSAMVEVDFVATPQPVQSLWVDREKGIIFAALGTAGFDAWLVDINDPDNPGGGIGFLGDFQNQLDDFNTAGFAYDVQSVTKTGQTHTQNGKYGKVELGS